MTAITTKEALLKVRDEILVDESRWTKGVAARFKNGRPVSPLAKQAASFCLAGALSRACDRDLVYSEIELAVPNRITPGGTHCIAYNDDPLTTFGDIRALLDRAIEEAGS